METPAPGRGRRWRNTSQILEREDAETHTGYDDVKVKPLPMSLILVRFCLLTLFLCVFCVIIKKKCSFSCSLSNCKDTSLSFLFFVNDVECVCGHNECLGC